uniref:Si:dkey-256h2.1 n=1 Tax=Sinocyclocheilus grahami TaxID=75366 RepID=A0A672T0F1_SINGR
EVNLHSTYSLASVTLTPLNLTPIQVTAPIASLEIRGVRFTCTALTRWPPLHKVQGRSRGVEPGDPAPAFQVQTLDGEFIYSPQNGSRSALIVHAFTNKSTFLECLWMWSGKEILSRLHFSLTSVFCTRGDAVDTTVASLRCFSSHQVSVLEHTFDRQASQCPIRLAEWSLGCRSLQIAGCELHEQGNMDIYSRYKMWPDFQLLVYALPRNPIQDMNCLRDHCSTSINIPVSMVHIEPSVMQALRKGRPVNVTFQVTPSPKFFFAIDQKGALSEMGWFLYPTFRFMAWQSVCYKLKLFVTFLTEAQVILTYVSPLIPLLNDKKCAFTMKTVPWYFILFYFILLYPFEVTSLFSGGTFDKDYNSRYQEIKFSLPTSTKKVELYAVITAHGSDENFCGEFCVTSHHFLLNRAINNTLVKTGVHGHVGSPLGCAMRVPEAAVPNEHGTWLYGRGGWCDRLQMDPWRTDITSQLDMTGTNSILYFGIFVGRNPDPKTNPGYIIMYSFLVFYK